jgi:hypothetical protein
MSEAWGASWEGGEPEAGFACSWHGPDPEDAARFYGAVLGWAHAPGARPVVARRGARTAARLHREPGPARWVPRLPAAGGLPHPETHVDPDGHPFILAPAAPDALAQPDAPGLPCWYELLVPHPSVAAAFYASLSELEAQPREYDGRDHQVLFRGGRPVASITAHGDGEAPGWRVYFTVGDCTAALTRVGAAGGRVVAPCEDLPALGRYARVADPAGVVVGLKELPRGAGGSPAGIP